MVATRPGKFRKYIFFFINFAFKHIFKTLYPSKLPVSRVYFPEQFFCSLIRKFWKSLYNSVTLFVVDTRYNVFLFLHRNEPSVRRRNLDTSQTTRSSNIRRLYDDKNDDDKDNATWNGNSTQQM